MAKLERKGGKLIKVVIPLVVLVLVIIAGAAWYQRLNPEMDSGIIQITPEPNYQETFEADQELTQEEASPSASPASDEGSAESQEEDVEVDKSVLVVNVLNGSGVAGQAGVVKNIFVSLGYEDISTGNADNFDYTETVIEYKSDYLDLAQEIESELDDYSVVLEELSDDSDYDIIVTIGTKSES